MIHILENGSNCCGCGACVFSCPKKAIKLEKNELGFDYPVVDTDNCINCGLCDKVCGFSKEKIVPTNGYNNCFAVVNKATDQINKSTSGGAFSAIAVKFINDGGYVCGAYGYFENNVFNVKHILINNVAELYKLQGSKYVQSDISSCFQQIRTLLLSNNKVLFSGTPCQVQAIKQVFSKYLNTQLYLIDIVCHGVPSTKILNDYIQTQVDSSENLEDITFRSKEYGWTLKGFIKTDKTKVEIDRQSSSYFHYFVDGEIYRNNCYKCPFATKDRVGDITIGDCWGIQTFAPDLLIENGGFVDLNKGVSCLLVNNNKGMSLIDNCRESLYFGKISFDDVIVINEQLVKPSSHTELRDKLLKMYLSKGYKAVDRYYHFSLLPGKVIETTKALIPQNLKDSIKKLIGR